MTNSDISLDELLTLPGVAEHCDLASPNIGVMAYHGGELEKVTDVVASEVARRSGASLYMVTQASDPVHHIASARVSPDHSPSFASFVDHVDCSITIHGYGLKERSRDVLLGGQNRVMASTLAELMRPALPEYNFCDDLDIIPKRLQACTRPTRSTSPPTRASRSSCLRFYAGIWRVGIGLTTANKVAPRTRNVHRRLDPLLRRIHLVAHQMGRESDYLEPNVGYGLARLSGVEGLARS